MDISSAPILVDITVDGRPVKAVAQPTKQGILYVFDRVTGKPVWPIEEKPAPQGDTPGEWYSPTQPIPTKPPAYARNGVSVDDLIDFTPELRDQAQTLVAKYKIGPVFTPPVVSKVDGPLATLTLGTASGGTNWPGGSYDPETHTAYIHACNACLTPIGLVRPPKGFTDLDWIAGVAGRDFRMMAGPGENSGADSAPPPRPPTPPAGGGAGGGGVRREWRPQRARAAADQAPLYATICGDQPGSRRNPFAQIAHGETRRRDSQQSRAEGPEHFTAGPGQSGYNIRNAGDQDAGDCGRQPDPRAQPSGTRGAIVARAYDKATVKEVGAVFLPAQESGSPMTYMHKGRQYIVIAVSGGAYSGRVPGVPAAGRKMRASLGRGPSPRARYCGRRRNVPVWDGVYTPEQAHTWDGRSTPRNAPHAMEQSLAAANPRLRWPERLSFPTGMGSLWATRFRAGAGVHAVLNNPGRLSREDNADVLACVLQANRFPAGKGELDKHAEVLKQIKLLANPPAK